MAVSCGTRRTEDEEEQQGRNITKRPHVVVERGKGRGRKNDGRRYAGRLDVNANDRGRDVEVWYATEYGSKE